MTIHQLASAPRLGPELARGALGALRKRGPYAGARLPEDQFVLRAATVDGAKLRAYARVCGFADGPGSEYGNGSGDGAAAALPPAYPHILGFPLAMRLMAQRTFPFPLLGLVHTGIELTQLRPLRTDHRPEITVYTEGPEPHRRGTQFGMVTEARIDGELVWHSRSGYLCRHRTAAPDEAAATGEPQGRAAAPLPVRATWDLPNGLGRQYAAASGDRNPIHLHPLTARLFGFPRHIAHGMWSFARCLAEAAPKGPAEGQRLTARARFRAPVLLPTTVSYGMSTAAGATGDSGPGEATAFELRSGKDGQRLHLTGTLQHGA